MKIMRSFLVLITLCLLTITGFSSTNKEQSKINADSLSAGTFDPNSREDRVAIAKILLAEINSLDRYIPAPSPDDITWVNEERMALKQKFTFEREDNLISSSAFQELKLKNYLKALRGSLICIIATASLAKEMYCWGVESSLLVDQMTINDAILVLQQNHKISNNLSGNSSATWTGLANDQVGYNEFYHSNGESILQHILLPYLAGSIHS